MFQSFQKYNRILVTGPMRSGTTICAAMIARDAGKTLVREEEMFTVWPYMPQTVVQAPVLLPEVRRLCLDGWFIVIMQRKLDDTYASVKKFMDGRLSEELCMKMVLEQSRQAAEVSLWLEAEGPGQTVCYEELGSHPMWVDDRSKFGPRDITTSSTDRTLRS